MNELNHLPKKLYLNTITMNVFYRIQNQVKLRNNSNLKILCLNVLCIRIFHFISKSEKPVDIFEEKEYKRYKLKAKGVVCGDNTSLVSALVASIKGRFDDVLEDELAANTKSSKIKK
jgi:hypothetical protein